MATYNWETVKQLVDALRNKEFTDEDIANLRRSPDLGKIRRMVDPKQIPWWKFIETNEFIGCDLAACDSGHWTRGPINRIYIASAGTSDGYSQMLRFQRAWTAELLPGGKWKLIAENESIGVNLEHFHARRTTGDEVEFSIPYIGGFTILLPEDILHRDQVTA